MDLPLEEGLPGKEFDDTDASDRFGGALDPVVRSRYDLHLDCTKTLGDTRIKRDHSGHQTNAGDDAEAQSPVEQSNSDDYLDRDRAPNLVHSSASIGYLERVYHHEIQICSVVGERR